MSPAARTYASDRLPIIKALNGAAFRDRLYLNALSSQPLAFSIAGELRAHPDAAARVMASLSGQPVTGLATLTATDDAVPATQKGVRNYRPLETYSLAGIEAEWFPPRWAHTGDQSGFDIAACVNLASERRMLISIEVKYTDSFSSDKAAWDRYQEDMSALGLDETSAERLVEAGCSQVLRQVMITDSVRRNGLAPDVGPDGRVVDVVAVVLAREDDLVARRAVDLLSDTTSVDVQFWSHRDLFEAAEVEPALEAWAGQMADRYLVRDR